MYITIVLVIMSTGCGVLKPPHKANGYYTSHFNSCGPDAIHEAIQHYAKRNGMHLKQIPPTREISKRIQDTKSVVDGRVAMSLLHRDFIAITWPHEIVEVCEQYGFKVTQLSGIDQLKPNDTGIVLIHKRMSLVYHWVCYPVDRVSDFYGDDRTAVLDIFLLTR